jgi:hypothetical protein
LGTTTETDYTPSAQEIAGKYTERCISIEEIYETTGQDWVKVITMPNIVIKAVVRKVVSSYTQGAEIASLAIVCKDCILCYIKPTSGIVDYEMEENFHDLKIICNDEDGAEYNGKEVLDVIYM